MSLMEELGRAKEQMTLVSRVCPRVCKWMPADGLAIEHHAVADV